MNSENRFVACPECGQQHKTTPEVRPETTVRCRACSHKFVVEEETRPESGTIQSETEDIEPVGNGIEKQERATQTPPELASHPPEPEVSEPQEAEFVPRSYPGMKFVNNCLELLSVLTVDGIILAVFISCLMISGTMPGSAELGLAILFGSLFFGFCYFVTLRFWMVFNHILIDIQRNTQHTAYLAVKQQKSV